jgi:rhodanese-related sulfurtransferase
MHHRRRVWIKGLLCFGAVLSISPSLLPLPSLAQSLPLTAVPPEAHKLVSEKKAILIDIRTPGEWAETGVAEGALTLDMTDPMFMRRVADAVGGDRSKPIALICRTASRSGTVQQAMMQSGYINVINVEGGMIGNRADKGWLKHGLPLKKE